MCRLACANPECCCCFKRPTGARLIGFFYIVLFFLGLLGPILELNLYRQTKGNLDEASKSNGSTVVTLDETVSVVQIMERQKYGHQGFEFTMITVIIALLVGILVNVLMVWGVSIKNCWLLVPWLIYQVLNVLVHLCAPIFSIYSATYVDYGWNAYDRRWEVFLALIPIGFGALGMYFWFVIRELFSDLDKPAKVNDNPNVVVYVGTGAATAANNSNVPPPASFNAPAKVAE